MISYAPTANASVANDPPTGGTPPTLQRVGFTPFTPGQPVASQPQTPVAPTAPGALVTNKGTLGNIVANIGGGIKGLFNAVTGSEQAVGGEIASGLPASVTGENMLNTANSSLANSQLAFMQKVHTLQASGKPISAPMLSAYQGILKQGLGTGVTQTDLLPHAADTTEQALGNVAGVGADILSAGTLPGAAKAASVPGNGILQGTLRGAKAGAIAAAPVGAAYGLSSGLKNNESALGVTGSTLFGALTGAAGGAVVGGTIGAIKANPKVVTNYDSAIKDVTPDYSQLTPTQKENLAEQTQKGGLISGRSIVPGQQQENAAAALASVDGYKPNASALEKFQLANDEVSNESQAIRAQIRTAGADGGPIVIPKKQMVSTIQSAIDNTVENSLLLQKGDPAAINYMRVVNNAVNNVDGTAEGVLDLRQALDKTYENTRGSSAFPDGSDKIAALDQVHTAARDALNKLLIDSAPNAQVRTSMKYQTALYNAMDILRTKASKEAGSVVGSLLQILNQHPILKKALLVAGGGALLKAGFDIVP